MLITCDMSGAYRTTDGGQSWEMIHHNQLRASTRCRPTFHPKDPEVILGANSYRGELRVSRDRGVTWSPIGEGLPKRGIIDLAIDAANGDFLLAGTGDGLFYSADGGKTWKPGAGFSGRPVGLHIDQTSSPGERRCFAATAEGVFVSTDGGANWERLGEGLPAKELVDFTGGSNSERCV
ncbi:MAG: hypothetical protein GY953_32945, partial [bacterium]|nr:hypothetical protein [bacterium]